LGSGAGGAASSRQPSKTNEPKQATPTREPKRDRTRETPMHFEFRPRVPMTKRAYSVAPIAAR